jgi:type IV secretory pathway VirB2 component (pilin)
MKKLLLIITIFTLCCGYFKIAVATDSTTEVARDQVFSASEELGESICQIVNIMTGRAGIVFFAIVLTATGIAVLQGKVSPGLFIGLGCGIGMFFAAPVVLDFITPSDRAAGGCACKEKRNAGYFYDASGNKVAINRVIPLKSDCTKKT